MLAASCGEYQIKTGAYKDLCVHTLKENGYRVTNPRRVVAEAIEQLGKAFTVKSLHEFVEAENHTKFDFATVYRIVQTYETLGLVHPDSRSGGFVPCTHLSCGDFIHVIYSCTDCQESFEDHLPSKLAESVSKVIKKAKDFTAVSSVMQVKGLCSDCSNK